jgi:hypothetical protein
LLVSASLSGQSGYAQHDPVAQLISSRNTTYL